MVWRSTLEGAAAEVCAAAAVGMRSCVEAELAATWAAATSRARSEWTQDFDGQQFTLGRAFYTHYETDRSGEYFASAGASDALVERTLPGMQAKMRELIARATGARVIARRDWCGPGVHIFPAGGEVASKGGVVHFDTEGLVQSCRPAVTLVVMLQEPESGGGLKLWDVCFRDHDTPTKKELARRSVVARYGVGSALVIDSYRLHQIQPFAGSRDRISITVHAAEVDDRVWETWF